MSFYSTEELHGMGFRFIGKDVQISRKSSLYGCSRISIGNYSRIDDFCVLSAGDGGIFIGSRVHIALMCSLIGSARIELHDFSGLSSRVSIYSSSDDYTGASLTNPTVPAEFKAVESAPVTLGEHVIIGSGTVILPGTAIGEGAAVGALSLARGVMEPFKIYSGVPARVVKERRKDLLSLAAKVPR